MDFLAALRFLTIIPVPGGDPQRLGRSQVFFPLVGLLLGLMLVGLDWVLSPFLPVFLLNALLLLAMVVVTGALHLEGFVDTCDGLAVRSSSEERLNIMSDSRVGAFGVVGVVSLLLLKYAALLSLPDSSRIVTLLLMPVLSRWGMVYAIFAFPPARSEGLGAIFKSQATTLRFIPATLLALAIAVFVGEWAGLALMAALAIMFVAVGSYLARRLGGLTGDTYGALNELGEVAVLLCFPSFLALAEAGF